MKSLRAKLPEFRIRQTSAAPRDIREVSLPPISDDHLRIARRHNGAPITYRDAAGIERDAIRLNSVADQEGEILIDYRSELAHLTDCLADFLRIPPSARH